MAPFPKSFIVKIEAVVKTSPGNPVVKTSPSNAEGKGSISGLGAKIPSASQPKHQDIKQKQYWKDFKNDPQKKKKSFKKTHHNWSLKKKKRSEFPQSCLSVPVTIHSVCGWVVPLLTKANPTIYPLELIFSYLFKKIAPTDLSSVSWIIFIFFSAG